MRSNANKGRINKFLVCTEHYRRAVARAHTLHQLQTDSSEAILIGDTHADALCAHHVQTGFVLHLAGYGGQEALDCPSDAQFHRYSELHA